MVKLLMIADDFTGALDTGVQFAARGAVTRIVTDPSCNFTQADAEVLVVVAETRHLPPKKAYDVVYQAVRKARSAGIPYIYKKTDSALRGNIGAELTAAMGGAEADRIAFLPAFPKMNRVTRNGVHYIDGMPVAESVFGQDPFEPVRRSAVAEVIGEQVQTPVVLHPLDENPTPTAPGIQVYDAVTDADLVRIARQLGTEGLHLSAGCAGFATALADILELNGPQPQMPLLPRNFFVACGSVNPVTLRQMKRAEQNGFVHIHLNPTQKLEPSWLEQEDCGRKLQGWLAQSRTSGRFILDVNDPADVDDTEVYAKAHGLTTEDLRIRISTQLAHLMKRLLDGGLDATLLCTGGDTLLALTRTVGVSELTPVREVAPGAVLTHFVYQGKTYYIISKSGGFGEPDLFCKLAASIRTGNHKEDAVC
jgi:uncharacterized protein YgbK (DUF1537 family)